MKNLLTLFGLLLPVLGYAYNPMQGKKAFAPSLPVFIENKGQIVDQYQHYRNDIDFKLNAGAVNIFISAGQIHYQWNKQTGPADSGYAKIETCRLDVSLIGANTHIQPVTEQQQEYYENYYQPSTPDGVSAHSCGKIIYKNIYPGIDWVLYTDANNYLKYDFIVHTGADAKLVRLKYEGATRLEQVNGAIKAETPLGNITEQVPYSYERKSKKMVASAYVLHGNLLSFNIADHTGDVVIDPQIEWATYYGGASLESQFCALVYTFNLSGQIYRASYGSAKLIAIDTLGSLYMIGNTLSNNNIATSGAYQSSFSDSTDAFLVKFNSAGQVQWSSYYGGIHPDYFASVICDRSNNIYCVGATRSTNMATSTGFQSSVVPGFSLYNYAAFAVKFNSMGQRQWATYYGGNNNNYYDITRFEDVSVDTLDNVYISGTTCKNAGIATPGSYQDTLQRINGYLNDSNTAFLVKFSPLGQRIWGTYFGGGNPGNVYYTWNHLQLDDLGHIYLSGFTSAKKGIATDGTTGAGYLAKFDLKGKLEWGTRSGVFLYINGLACDKQGNVYVAGGTSDSTGIGTAGTYQPHQKGTKLLVFSGVSSDGFLIKYAANGEKKWGTYFGGEHSDMFCGLTIDQSGDILLSGETQSDSFIATSGAWHLNKSGIKDGMVVKFDTSGQRLWATYYGGEKQEDIRDVKVDRSNNAYFSGSTNSLTGMSTLGSHQQQLADLDTSALSVDGDLFLLKTNPDSIVYLDKIDSVFCRNSNGIQLQIGYIVSKSFRQGNIFTAQLSDINGSFASPTIIGTKTATASGAIDCVIPTSISFGKGYRIRVVSSAPYYVSNDNGTDIELKPGPEKPVAAGDTLLCSGSALHLSAFCATAGVSYSWAGPNGFGSTMQSATRVNIELADSGDYIVTVSPLECRMTDTLFLHTKYTPTKPNITTNSPVCEGDTLRLYYQKDMHAGTSYGINWPDQNVIMTDTVIKGKTTLKFGGRYFVLATDSGCTTADTAVVVIKPLPYPHATSNSPIRPGKDLELFADGDTATTTFVWTGPNGFASTDKNPVLKKVDYNAEGDYIVLATSNGCSATDTVTVVIDDAGDDFFVLFPNPNNGSFTVMGSARVKQEIAIKVVNSIGQKIYEEKDVTFRKTLNKHIVLPAVAAGAYYLYLRADGKTFSLPFVVDKK